MTQKLQPVRGTHDILPEEARLRRLIVEGWRGISESYGYGEIETPVFEFTDIFHRTLGDTSDVVTKETYTFTDRGGESLTLRPEFTAACVRAFLSNGLQNELPIKWFYHGPAFRYERPQKGRLRQFHQVGAELLGVAGPEGDIEAIAMAAHGLRLLGFSGAVTLELNSLGDAESRQRYRHALVGYFKDHQAQLSADSKQRLEKNPLRILDSKDEGDRAIIAGAPLLTEYFTDAAKDFFDKVQAGLTALSIAYRLNPKLVRGLDYYHHTVFEFTTDKLGAQGTVLAGGRYDGLVKLMGGPEVPGVGWAAGVERMCELCRVVGYADMTPPRPVAVIPLGEACEAEAWKLAQSLREVNIATELLVAGNLGKRMKRADKLRARIAVLLGEDELRQGVATLKHLDSGTQETVARDRLIAAVAG